MKKFISILLFFAVFAFFGCDNLANSGEDGKGDGNNKPSIENNLPESKGTNELANKTFEDPNTKIRFSFSNSTVNTSSAPKASLSIVSRSSEEISSVGSKFNYSFDSTSDPKTLQFQLAGIFDDDTNSKAQSYEEQVSMAGFQYDLLSTALLALLNGDALYKSFEDLGTEYVSKIKNSVTSKATEYVSTQKSILNDYLKSKYESVIHFNYELNEEALILTEQFKGDLTSASAKFVGKYGEAIITLNDYDNVIPFKVEVPNDEDGYDVYIGVPKVEVSTETTGTITVDMFSYPGNMLESSKEVIQNISRKITETIQNTLIEIILSESLEEIKSELDSSNSSPIVDDAIDEAIGSFKLKVSYTISGNTLTFTFEVDGCPSFLTGASSSNSFDLTYTPLLGATYNIVK